LVRGKKGKGTDRQGGREKISIVEEEAKNRKKAHLGQRVRRKQRTDHNCVRRKYFLVGAARKTKNFRNRKRRVGGGEKKEIAGNWV